MLLYTGSLDLILREIPLWDTWIKWNNLILSSDFKSWTKVTAQSILCYSEELETVVLVKLIFAEECIRVMLNMTEMKLVI